MAVVIMDGLVRVYWLAAAPANLALPTVAELNAGTNIGIYIRPDGLDISMDSGTVDVGNVTSDFTLERVGRRKPTVALGCHHDSSTGSTDPAWALLLYRALGVLAVRTGVLSGTAWTTGQGGGGTTGGLMMIPVECGEFNPSKPGPDTTWDFDVPLKVYQNPSWRAVVA
jgi:hypothetical protein